MMGFVDNLNSNPQSGIYGHPGIRRPDVKDPLSLFKRIKDRELIDYKNKAEFAADLSVRQESRMRSLFDPNKLQSEQSGQDTSKMNTVMAQDPNQMTGYQKGQLGVRQQELNLDSQKLDQTNRFGQQALDIKDNQQKLNQEKSDQINSTKQADMQRKVNEADQKIELAQKALEQKTNNAASQLQLHKDMAAAIEERHKLELANKQSEFDVTSKQHQEQIDAIQKRLDQDKESTTTTELNADGTKRTSTTKKGGRVKVKGPNGESGTVDAGEELPEGWSVR